MMLNNYKVPDQNRKVSLSAPMVSKDISGQTASTSKVDEGQKSQKISVSLTINFSDSDKLAELQAVAKAKDEADKPVVYTVVDPLAKAMKIRQVVFVDTFRVTEGEGQHWQVSFSLSEHKSVAEKKEQRVTETTETTQNTDTDTVTVTETEDAANGEELTSTEGFLAKLDRWLS